MARLRFDKYTEIQKSYHWFARALFHMNKEEPNDDRKTNLLALGNAKLAANSPIRGHLRTPKQAMATTFNRYAFLMSIDEHRTSKLCSHDHRVLKRSINYGEKDR